MLPTIFSFWQVLRRVILMIVLVGLFNLAGWFIFVNQPSYAAVSSPKEELNDIRKDLERKNPQEMYEEALDVSKDPKMGEQKKYEENLKKYKQENPDQGGLLKGAKELVNQVTGND